jgi:two-component system response regulator
MTTDKYVLLVEDNPDDVILTQVAFRKAEIANPLQVTADGVAAMDFLFCRGRYAGRDPNDKPALILLDIKLPLINGVQVFQAIHENTDTSNIPVIVLTSSMEASDQRICNHLGVTNYLQKPASLSKFIEIVRDMKFEWLD